MQDHEYSALLQVISCAYDAALEPRRWGLFLDRAVRLFDGHMGTLLLMDAQRSDSLVAQLSGFDEDLEPEFVARREHEDYWYKAGKGLPSGSVVTGSGLVPVETMHKAPLYREIARPMDAEYMLGGVIANGPELKAYLSVIRPAHGRDFEGRAEEMMALLIPHIEKAHLIHRRLADVEVERRSVEQVLNHVPYGLLFIDSLGRCVYSNPSARDILAERDALSLHRDRIRLTDVEQQAQFDRLVRQACAAGQGVGLGAGGKLAVRRPSSKLALQMLVAPLNARSGVEARVVDAACVVFVHDPTQPGAVTNDVLTTFYGLTQAEAKVCSALYNGLSLADICKDFGISHNTAKTHLKRVFVKCGVRSQAELLQLLALGLKDLTL